MIMYLKLSLRNAKRSIFNYIIYIITLTILFSIMQMSHFITIAGKIHSVFQTLSLPLVIAIILLILMSYTNNFMLKQRAKEFANYLLMGMEKKKLMCMFFVEFWLIGIFCFSMSIVICLGISLLFFRLSGMNIWRMVFLHASYQTFFYFCLLEVLSIGILKRKFNALEIRELMIGKRKNQKKGSKEQTLFWGILFGMNLSWLLWMLFGIMTLEDHLIFVVVSLIAIPLLFTIYSFYNLFFQLLSKKRRMKQNSLYQKDFLYLNARMTSKIKTEAVMNSLFCICLLFSFISFIFGFLLFQPQFRFGDRPIQRWMGILQMNLGIIFIVLYLSMLSLQIIIELSQQVKDLQILFYLGKDSKKLQNLIKQQILLKFCFPTIMFLSLLIISLPFLNHKLNASFPKELKDSLLVSTSGFFLCFILVFFSFSWQYIAWVRNTFI